MRLEQLADFFASVLVGLEVAMVTLAQSHSQWHIHWRCQMSKLFLPKTQSDTRRGIRNNIMVTHHS